LFSTFFILFLSYICFYYSRKTMYREYFVIVLLHHIPKSFTNKIERFVSIMLHHNDLTNLSCWFRISTLVVFNLFNNAAYFISNKMFTANQSMYYVNHIYIIRRLVIVKYINTINRLRLRRT
jgi:hypothetical protein